MNKLSFSMFFMTILFGVACSPVKQADRRANKDKINTLYPDFAFDETVAKNGIAYGKSTIRGVLFTKEKQKLLGNKGLLAPKIYGSYVNVTLFPVTPYFEAWYSLREKKESKKTVVYMSEEAFKHRIDNKTDEYGRFAFEKMRTGKYFLQAFMTTSFTYTAPVQVGSGYTNDGRNISYYEQRAFNRYQYERIEKFVEIKTDGEVVEVKLK